MLLTYSKNINIDAVSKCTKKLPVSMLNTHKKNLLLTYTSICLIHKFWLLLRALACIVQTSALIRLLVSNFSIIFITPKPEMHRM